MPKSLTELDADAVHARGVKRSRFRSRVKLGRFEAETELQVTPGALLAVGGLVALILLSVAPVILAGRRRLPPPG